MNASPRRAHIKVPATSANLGPGFDALGLALDLHDEVDVEVAFGGPVRAATVDVTGVGADTLPRDESHLVARSMRATLAELDCTPSSIHLTCRNVLPHGRGLGSSAAAIVAGVAAAHIVANGDLDRQAALRVAARLEGHPDNVSACVLGGLTIAWTDADAHARAARIDVHPQIQAIICIPSTEVPTATARRLLPDTVPHRDAATNAARAALLVEALSRRPDLLFDATEDRLHQEYRQPAMPATIALVKALRERGHAAVVSGAGPSVVVLARAGQRDEIAPLADTWDVRELSVDQHGVTAIDLGEETR